MKFSERTFSRRRFIATVAALTPAICSGASPRASAGDTIDVKSLGAFGNGKLPDLRQIREALRLAADRSSGATVFFPPGEYFLGAADDAVLLDATQLRNVRLVGDRATLTCRSVSGQSTMLQLSGCRNVTIEGLAFRDHGLNRDVNWLGAAAIRLSNFERGGCEDIEIRNCSFDSVLTAVVCRRSEDNLRIRTRNIKLTDLKVRRSYYGFSFQDNGDNVVGRGLRCDDVKRSYFPFGVTNHDIELDTANNATGFTDVLIKCYHADTSRIKAKVRCRGKRSGDAIVALDHQHEKGRGTIRQIDLQLDVDDVDCRLDTVVLIRSFDPAATYERQTQNRWDEIAIEGDVRICDKTKLIDIATVGKTPGSLRIGPKLAKNPRLPRTFPGFNVSGV
jgi:hypothetical protein